MTNTDHEQKDAEQRASNPLDVARLAIQDWIPNRSSDALNETQLAIKLAELLQGTEKLATYCHKSFYCYDPGRGIFARVPEVDLRNFLYDLDGLERPTDKPFKVNKGLADRVIRILADRLHDQSFFDTSIPEVAVPNGFLTFCDNKLETQDHLPSNRARLFVPYDFAYDGNAETTKLDAFFAKVLVDPELVSLFFEMAGVALFGQGTKYQMAAILVGEGANGKGVATQLLERLIPPFARCSVTPSDWGEDYKRSPFVGSILNTCGEIPPIDGACWQWMKGIIAGDLTTARYVGGSPFELRPVAQHFLSTNLLPPVQHVGRIDTSAICCDPLSNHILTGRERHQSCRRSLQQGSAWIVDAGGARNGKSSGARQHRKPKGLRN